jgi:glutaredoxin 3
VGFLHGIKLACHWLNKGLKRFQMPKITMYSTQVCPYCNMAERLLLSKGAVITEKILIDKDPSKKEEMMTRTGRRTVPQIYIDDTHVGGFDDLSALDRAGKLDPLLGK